MNVKYDYTEYACIMKALSEETRLKILVMLTEGELCACKILEDFRITQPTLSHHMKTLKSSGLVKSRRDGVWIKYTLDGSRLGIVEEFLRGLASSEEKGTGVKAC